MIGFFPKIYPDELLFSLFSRYYVNSGYLTYISVGEDLFIKPTNKPSIEFCNLLTNDVIKILTQDISFKELILKHTMFNYYNAFLPLEKQKQAIDYLLSMNTKDLTSLLPIPQNKSSRFLRYCPLCVNKDRNLYGESYWHCSHQLYGISCCSEHGCKLINSDIPITADSSPILITLEEILPKSVDKIAYANEIEKAIATYATKILNNNYTALSKSPIGEYFHYCLQDTKYVSKRGIQRNIKSLHNDFLNYYKDIDLLGFNESWQLEKLFNNKRFNSYENCLFGLFLGISPNDLCERHIPKQEQNRQKNFDTKIKQLYKEGYNYRQISVLVGISYDHCKKIGSSNQENKPNRTKRYSTKSGVKCKDFNLLDNELLPRVKQTIEKLNGNSSIRPIRITVGRISRELNISVYTLKRLPCCYSYILTNTEAIEKYFAREIVWAYKQLTYKRENISRTKLCNLINLDKSNCYSCLPYLTHFIDTVSAKYISSL